MPMKSVTEDLEMAEKNIEGEAEKGFIRQVIVIGKKFNVQRERNDANAHLSDSGKKHEDEVLAQMIDAELGVFESETTAKIEGRIGNLTGAIEMATAPPAPVGDAVTVAVKEGTKKNTYAEIRRSFERLGPLDALLREEAFLNAPPLEQEAMANGPMLPVKTRDGVRWEPWVRPELIEQTRMGRASAKSPELVDGLRVLQAQRMTLKTFCGVLRSAIRKQVPLTSAEHRLRDLDGRDVTVPARK